MDDSEWRDFDGVICEIKSGTKMVANTIKKLQKDMESSTPTSSSPAHALFQSLLAGTNVGSEELLLQTIQMVVKVQVLLVNPVLKKTYCKLLLF
jgi:hypothetical protein